MPELSGIYGEKSQFCLVFGVFERDLVDGELIVVEFEVVNDIFLEEIVVLVEDLRGSEGVFVEVLGTEEEEVGVAGVVLVEGLRYLGVALVVVEET